jgi:4a-hydroxytetrahydrobiopterin dehydratase
MTTDKDLKVYTEEEVNQRLAKELAHWKLENGWIRRKYRTESWKATLMVVTTIGHLAEAAWHHPDLTVSYGFVIVKLMTHSRNGISDRDFELAKKIEDVVLWQPSKEGGALEGTPADDPRFKYIRYES